MGKKIFKIGKQIIEDEDDSIQVISTEIVKEASVESKVPGHFNPRILNPNISIPDFSNPDISSQIFSTLDISTLDISTPDFSTLNSSYHRLFPIFNHELGVEKTGVEIPCNSFHTQASFPDFSTS